MLLRRIGYLLLLLGAVLLAAWFETWLTGFILALTLTLPVLAFVLSLPGMLGLYVRLRPGVPVRSGAKQPSGGWKPTAVSV